MRFLNTLYIGETARETAEQIMDDVRSGRYVKDVYVLIEPLSEGNQIEVLQSYYLRQRYYQEMDPMVLGVAKGKSEALELVVSPVNIKTRVRADPTISVEHLAALLVA